MKRWIDLFAGPGGWDWAAKQLGLDVLGIELEAIVCETREAAGLTTLQGDVAALQPERFAPVHGMIGSPPCPSFSQANDDRDARDVQLVIDSLRAIADGDRQLAALIPFADPRSALTLEPLRWALILKPVVIALEQVPPVLPIWKEIARHLEDRGYSAWAGILEAERYGVPQTRERAFLIARRDGVSAHPPAPTHQQYVPKIPADHEIPLFGEPLKPWVSMAKALGWGMTGRPAPTIQSAGTSGGGPRPLDGGSGARGIIEREQAEGRWKLKNGNQANATERNADEPASTIAFGHNAAAVEWIHERPATTVQGDPRIWPPGHKADARDVKRGTADEYGDRRGSEAIRVEPWEAGVLQGFPADYPWQGTRTAQFAQVGNAVPPPLAGAVLGELTCEDPAVNMHADHADARVA